MRLIGTQADEVTDGDDLQERLELTKAFGLEHLTRSGRDKAQASDQEFADEDEHHAERSEEYRSSVYCKSLASVSPLPNGQAVNGGEADEQAEDEDLVDQGVHQAAEVGHGVQLAGDPAVKDVGQGGQDEEGQGGAGPRAGPVGPEGDQEDRRQAGGRQEVGEMPKKTHVGLPKGCSRPRVRRNRKTMSRLQRIAVYPGTFDPITLGHLDVLRRASRLFDKVIVAVAASDSKHPWFSVEERLGMARQACKGIRNVKVLELEGLTVEFARKHQAAAIIRGLRKFSDFEFEFDLAHANRLMAPEIETVILMPSQDQFVTSSSFVKDIARHKLSQAAAFVPRCVLPHLRKRLAEKA